MLLGLGVAALVNAALIVRRPHAAPALAAALAAAEVEAERWEAFRRYLTDFPRLQDAPPATLALWERLLVYGIAFGIAERVLQAAHLAMPEALAQASSIYWISPTAGTSARDRRRLRSAISPPGSAPRSRRPRRAPADSAAASRAAVAEAAVAAAAARGRPRQDRRVSS